MDVILQDNYLSTLNTNILYIDKITYNSLKEIEISEEEIYQLFYKPNDKISATTYNYIYYLNAYINSFLFSLVKGYKDNRFSYLDNLTEVEKDFIKEKVKNYLFKEQLDPNNDKKFYEIKAFIDNKVLVIIDESFLATITKNKDKLLEFNLDILRFLDSLDKVVYYYNKLYLNLRLNENYFNLLRSMKDL